jgi:hypothetical protein
MDCPVTEIPGGIIIGLFTEAVPVEEKKEEEAAPPKKRSKKTAAEGK